MIVQGLIRQVLGFLERDGKTLSTGRDVRAEALRIVGYIRSHLGDTLTLAGTAAFAGYSPAYFSKYFKRLMGLSFQDLYGQGKRIWAAKDMLLEGKTVTEAAALLQYDSPSSFCRAFRRIAGYSLPLRSASWQRTKFEQDPVKFCALGLPSPNVIL